uniref:Nascent polypeptide-associated complex subunit beta n=1 Tax=Oryza nivara TaxID=4536 RepID=A0A0E0J4U9_ORYNI
MDEDYLILPKDEPFFYQDDLNLCDPEGTAFPAPYIGELGLLHPTTLGGDDAEPEEAAAPSFPQFIGDLSAQPPPPTPGGSVKAAPQFIGDDVSAQPPYHNGAGEGSGLPPAMSSGMEEAAHLAPSNAPLHPFDDVFDLLEPFDEVPRPEETEELFAYALELDKGNDDQWILGAAHLDANPNQTPCSLLSQFDADSLLGTNHQTAIHNSAAATHQLVQEIPSSDTPPARAAADAMEMAELSRVADECGGEASMVWSSDEDELLLDGFSRLANQDSVSMCMEIAYGLPKKTAMDVALRIRWFQGKGIENPNKKRNKHALSERGQDCMSTKALIRDNSMLLDQIYDKLSTGQLACAPSMFDKVKMNLDAILAKMRAMGVNTDEYKLDLEALEEIKQGFHPSLHKRV